MLEVVTLACPWLVAFIVSFLVAPPIIGALKRHKVGQTIQADGPESHHSKAGTPAMGGIIIIVGILAGFASSLLALRTISADIFSISILNQLGNVIALFGLVIGYALVGLADDYLTVHPVRDVRGIASKPKAVIQLLLAVGFVLWLRQTGFDPVLCVAGKLLFLGEVYWVLAVLFISGVANFVNITDGLDGLVSGLFVIAGFPFALTSIHLVGYLSVPVSASVNGPIAFFVLMSVVGACLAFLWFNKYPAKVFMGDTGSLALGALLPAAAILTHKEILMIVIGSVFILDGFSTIIQWAVFKYTRIRTGTGRRVFLKSPIHHHFEMLGWPEQTVVVRFWICGVIAAVLGLAGAAIGWW